MLYKSEQRLLKVYTYKHTYTTRHTHMGNVNRAVSSFPIFPGSAAGAAALKSGQGPPGRGIAVRQFSPLRRREEPPPLPPTAR